MYLRTIQFPTVTTNVDESIEQYDNRTLRVLIFFANLPLPNPNVTEDDFESTIPEGEQRSIFVQYQNTNPQLNSRNDVRTLVARTISRIALQCPTREDLDVIFLHPLTKPFAAVGSSTRATGEKNDDTITVGDSEIQIECYRDGDYDFALMDLLLLSYTIRQYQDQIQRQEQEQQQQQRLLELDQNSTNTHQNSTNTTSDATNTTNSTTATPSIYTIISPEAQLALEYVMISAEFAGKMESLDGTTTSYELPCQIRNLPSIIFRRIEEFNIYLQIDDTENHTLMIQVARYLINQLYYTYNPNLQVDDYNNDKNGNTKKLLYLLSTFMNQDQFYEYNSKPYQGSTVVAINLLHTFANDQNIKMATQNLLDMITAYNTVQSDHLRRFVPFRRQPAYVGITQSWAGDGEYQRLAIQVGNQNVFPEIGKTECIMTTQSSYRIDPILVDLFFPSSFHPGNETTTVNITVINRSSKNTTFETETAPPNPLYFVGNTQVAQIYASTSKVLLSSGGHGTKADVGNRLITPKNRPLVQKVNVRLRYLYKTFVLNFLFNTITEEENGWSRPTAIIPRSARQDFRITDMVRFIGHRDVEEGAKEQNLCVAPNFVCGLQLDYGSRIGTDDIRTNCSVAVGNWTFWNLHHNETTIHENRTLICPNYGYYMAVYERPCDFERCVTKADTFGLIEIMEPNLKILNHSNNIDFRTFQEQVMNNNPGSFQSQGIMNYTTTDGHVVQFEIDPLKGNSSIVQYDQTLYERDYHNWPIARSRTIQSTTPGRITIDNEKYYNQRLILDMTIPTQPRRLITTIPKLRYSDNTIGTNDGRLFDDGSSIVPESGIRKITFYTNFFFQLLGYRMEWASGLAVTHGSDGVYSFPHYFNDDESIIIMNVGMSRLWNNINFIELQLNNGRRISSGYKGRDWISFVSKPTERICAFHGRASDRLLYQLGAIYTPSAT